MSNMPLSNIFIHNSSNIALLVLRVTVECELKEIKLRLRCVIAVVCRKTNGEVNISHENTTMVEWVYDGV